MQTLTLWCAIAAAMAVHSHAQDTARAYQAWLEQEVVCIISPAERAAFQRLRAEVEKRMFIEQFWLRRDPTPDTEINELREEPYRRIAYANSRFGYGDVEGWRSDGGAMYIRFGPPDELERHPAAETSAAVEKWRYRLLEGTGTGVLLEFEDPDRTGQFRMTRDPSGQLKAIETPALRPR